MSEAFGKVLPSFMAYCQVERKVTLHCGATDAHGCERGSICTCGAIRDARPCEWDTAKSVRFVPAKPSPRKKAS